VIVTLQPGGPHGWPKRLDEEEIKSMLGYLQHKPEPFEGSDGIRFWVRSHQEYGYALYRKVQELQLDPISPRFFTSNRAIAATPVQGRVETVWLLQGWEPAGEDYSLMATRLQRVIPDAFAPISSPCTCKDRSKTALWAVIQHLNDAHHPDSAKDEPEEAWSRERIADWLETLDLDLAVDPERAKRTRNPYMFSPQQDDAMKQSMQNIAAATALTTESVQKMIGWLSDKVDLEEFEASTDDTEAFQEEA
jgi:hypothetical protein